MKDEGKGRSETKKKYPEKGLEYSMYTDGKQDPRAFNNSKTENTTCETILSELNSIHVLILTLKLNTEMLDYIV